MKKILRALPIFCAMMLFGAVESCAAPSLPEIEGWSSGELRVRELDSLSGNHGVWQERSYRSPALGSFTVTMMTGNGPKYFYIPPAASRESYGATYSTHTDPRGKFVVETHALLGTSLAYLGDGISITIDSGPFGMDTAQIQEAARTIIDAMMLN